MGSADGDDLDRIVLQQFVQVGVDAAAGQPVLCHLGFAARAIPTHQRAHFGARMMLVGLNVLAGDVAGAKDGRAKLSAHRCPPREVHC